MVANFAHQNDVRVLAHNGPQAAGKGQVDLGIDLDLADSLELVFHRIFDGDDIDFRFVDG